MDQFGWLLLTGESKGRIGGRVGMPGNHAIPFHVWPTEQVISFFSEKSISRLAVLGYAPIAMMETTTPTRIQVIAASSATELGQVPVSRVVSMVGAITSRRFPIRKITRAVWKDRRTTIRSVATTPAFVFSFSAMVRSNPFPQRRRTVFCVRSATSATEKPYRFRSKTVTNNFGDIET